ncbi:hypothetical protein ACO0K9_16030 [Undibacterium sp. Ji50W]|uniref:hypothetical protein n=1 Tax=Undibacterium sp. Ji50W TaxID=3413041 RepID=UPI003BF3C376
MNKLLSLFFFGIFFAVANAFGASAFDMYLGPKLPPEQLATLSNPNAIIQFVDELGSHGQAEAEVRVLPGKHSIGIESKTSRDAVAIYAVFEINKEYEIIPSYQDNLWRPKIVEKLSGKVVSWMGFLPITDLKSGASRAQVEEIFKNQAVRASYSYQFKGLVYQVVHYNLYRQRFGNEPKDTGTDFIIIYRPDNTVFYKGTFTGDLLRSNDPLIQKMLPMIKERWANEVYGPPVAK